MQALLPIPARELPREALHEAVYQLHREMADSGCWRLDSGAVLLVEYQRVSDTETTWVIRCWEPQE